LKKFDSIKAKNESMLDKNENSRDSDTGYLNTGNPAQVHAKARAKRNNDNGSHY
jgi:hypothetical protein